MQKTTTDGLGSGDYKWIILGLLTIAQLVMSIGSYAWGPMAPFLRDEFGISRTQIGTIVSSLYFSSVIVALPAGFAVDRYGARPILVIALVTMGFPFFILSMVNQFSYFIVFAGLSGIGYGMINQISTKGIMKWFQSNTRATAMGIKQTGVTLGGAIGAILLPALSFTYNWRMAMLVVGLLIVMTALVSFVSYKENPEVYITKDEKSLESRTYISDWRTSFSKLWSNTELRIICLVGMLLASAQTCIASFMVLYLNENLNYSITISGTCLSLYMLSGTAGRIIWGVVSDRLFQGRRKKPIIIISIIACLSSILMSLLSPAVSHYLIFLISIVMGLTFMGWNAVYLTLVAEIAGSDLAGAVTGFTIAIVWIGIILGPPVFGFISDHIGYFWGWIMLSVFGFLAAILLARKNPAQGAQSSIFT